MKPIFFHWDSDMKNYLAFLILDQELTHYSFHVLIRYTDMLSIYLDIYIFFMFVTSYKTNTSSRIIMARLKLIVGEQ